ncbi:protein-tyrosine phosphatase-like protein [Lenzites betulinus]|nr:protein-tyrosine phosphatase-like protein [Lenzites betulinus]
MSATESTPPTVPDPDLVQKTLSSPPFIQIEGVFNVRDFGAGRPVSADATRRIKPLTLFRSGEVAHITERGIEQLRALAIAKVFDLRVDSEIAKNRTATRQIEGVDVVRAPIVQGGWGSDEMASRLKQFEEDPLGAFMRTYTQILECGTSALEKVLLHLRDHADVPCLIHCTGPYISTHRLRPSDSFRTGGKDRTGVFAAVILTLLGARDEDIVADYALTEVGMQPVLPMLGARLQKEAVFRDNWAGALRLGSSKPETMQAFLESVRREHGGVEGYLKTHTSLVDEDFERIRQNLLV